MGPGATRATASAAVEAVLASIQEATAEDEEKLHIAQFGTFERVQHAARRGYDINSGAMRDIPARSSLHFTPARQLLPTESNTLTRES